MLIHDRDFDPRHGEAVAVAEGVVRVTAANEGPFTFRGTNSYLIGDAELAILDPGPPDDAAHLAALLAAARGRPVRAILVSHTHRDHTGAVPALAAATGAEVIAEGPHRPARPLATGEADPLDAAGDTALAIDRTVRDGEAVVVDGRPLTVVETPGHTINHVAFALEEARLLFSADHVMAWSTTIVAPPDGAMRDYMASLDKLLLREDTLYLPGHGGPVRDPRGYVAGLKAHRLAREAGILARLAAGDRRVPEIVAVLYTGVDRRLHGAAGLSVLAHLEDLVERGIVTADPRPAIDAEFTIAGSDRG
jgi:glyoxylase-like metal-dependent hydrolase (beta-lactamase superfamily II)